ncbi:MAG TPA: VTT domain-containing protein [Terriglobales bacterium]|jgi:membrane protein YqaA with SNARE-associated domain
MHGQIEILLAGAMLAWFVRLGGPGLILLGIVDNSFVPITGSMDVLTIWLAASRRDLWYYYAIMATIGAVLGAYLTYSLARKGGKEALEHKLSRKKIDQVCRRFERWGFGAVAVPAILPPPFPLVPFVLAAGALQYSPNKFLLAIGTGRGLRYVVVAGLGAIYGKAIVGFFSKYYLAAVIALIVMAVVSGIFSYLEYRHLRRKKDDGSGAGVACRKTA